LFSAFSFARKGTKEKAWQKENATEEISRLARRDQRCARWSGGRFLEKATQKLL
jgi:hypothetical protein